MSRTKWADSQARLAGPALRQLRERAGLSQNELATQIGMSRQSIQVWEAGRGVPPKHEAMVVSVVRQSLAGRSATLTAAHTVLHADKSDVKAEPRDDSTSTIVNATQAAQIAGVTEKTVRVWIRQGKLRAKRAWLRQHMDGTTQTASWAIDVEDLAMVPGATINPDRLAELEASHTPSKVLARLDALESVVVRNMLTGRRVAL